MNNPRLKDRYRAEGIDQRFAEVLAEVLRFQQGELADRGVPTLRTLYELLPIVASRPAG